MQRAPVPLLARLVQELMQPIAILLWCVLVHPMLSIMQECARPVPIPARHVQARLVHAVLVSERIVMLLLPALVVGICMMTDLLRIA